MLSYISFPPVKKGEYMRTALKITNYYDNCEINEIATLFGNLYKNSEGFVKIMSGHNRKGYFYDPKILSDSTKLSAILESRRFGLDNAYASISTFKTMQKATLDNILTVNALAVDADFTTYPGQQEISTDEARKALEMAILNGFPEPSYIEYSRNMRLVYILDHPYIIPKNKKKAESCRSFLKRVTKCLCDNLNSYTEIINFHAEPQKLTSFIRIPYSVNKRSYGYYDYDRELYVIDSINRFLVQTNINESIFKWDIQKLSETVLPPLFDGYEDWKQKQKGKAKKVIPIRLVGVCERRLKELETLQDRGYGVGYREKMCYFYWITARQSGMTENEAVESVKNFNMRFPYPLQEHRLLTDCKPSDYIDTNGYKHDGWERKFKDTTIRAELGLGTDEPDLFRGEGMSNSDKCKAYKDRKRMEKEKAGETKQQQIAKQVEQVALLRSEGKTWQEVADILDISLRTAKNYGKRLKTGY